MATRSNVDLSMEKWESGNGVLCEFVQSFRFTFKNVDLLSHNRRVISRVEVCRLKVKLNKKLRNLLEKLKSLSNLILTRKYSVWSQIATQNAKCEGARFMSDERLDEWRDWEKQTDWGDEIGKTQLNEWVYGQTIRLPTPSGILLTEWIRWRFEESGTWNIITYW